MSLRGFFQNAKEVQQFTAGTTIFQTGDPGDCMYVILDGEVDVMIGERQISRLQSGDCFGEMALVDAEPRSATTVAHTDCRLARVDKDHFLFMVEETPHFALDIMHVIAERLRATS